MPNIDRRTFLALLDRLGGADDADVLAAAREASRRVASSGLGWEDLLRPPPAPVVELTGDDAVLIDRLLGASEISQATRAELLGFKDDLAKGALDPADRKYLHDLARRIGSSV
ncbi:MAG: hypothetical protein EXQ95_08285 [Alphaproteobacteria bacterium]|nr:hypothetical protein [Alphaproteobacteria bacterium]